MDGKRRILRGRGERGDRASGQGMLVGSLMLLAMHAPYGSDQISDRLPSPSSLCQSLAAKWTALHRWNWYIPTRGSFWRHARARVFSFSPFRSILNYRLTNSSACVPTVRFSLSFSLSLSLSLSFFSIRAQIAVFTVLVRDIAYTYFPDSCVSNRSFACYHSRRRRLP